MHTCRRWKYPGVRRPSLIIMAVGFAQKGSGLDLQIKKMNKMSIILPPNYWCIQILDHHSHEPKQELQFTRC